MLWFWTNFRIVDVNSLKVLFTSLPGRYARALFLEGKKESCLDEILDNFVRLGVFFKNNPSIKKLLTSYCMNQKDLDNGWLAVGNYLSFNPVFLAFVRQVVLNKRFEIINKIEYIFNVAFAKHKNRRNVIIFSAVELLPEQKTKLESLVERAFKEKSIVKYKIDKNILGGIKVSSEELIVDASYYAQLKQLSKFYKNLKLKVEDHEN